MQKKFFLYTIMVVTVIGLTATDAWASPRRAAGPKIEERTVCVTNATNGNNPGASCYSRMIKYSFETPGSQSLKTKSGSNAVSNMINYAGYTTKVCVKPYYDVNKPLTIKVFVITCTKYSYSGIPGGGFNNPCVQHKQDKLTYPLGYLSSSTTNFTYYQDCSLK